MKKQLTLKHLTINQLAWLLFLFISFCPNTFLGRHIIGGDISYECLGNDNYRFTLKIYRDCSNPNADYFDFNAPITIFKGNEEPYSQFEHTYATLTIPITSVPPDLSDPCLILPPNVCVQEGIYVFDLNLPLSDESYHITYQRCCRNNTISNIITPGSSGATYTMDLTPEAQQLCNNSPVFNDFPPVVICANEPLQFDHSATDVDGDQLVYELCSPLLGAGVVGFMIPGDPTSCMGFRPDPACPPPFDPVNFVVPTYGPLTPMAGDPMVSIDPNTGIISGTPNIQGQFVVGICVYEYRNGELLSVTRRDFQFNVANCEPTVFARIDGETNADGSFNINACENPVELFNLSVQQQFIDNFYWEFDIGGVTETFNSWNLQHSFPEGNHSGRLILNPGTDCGDTAIIDLNVFPGIEADFEFEYDTCIAGPVAFRDLSSTGTQNITNWDWQFGDLNSSSFRNPSHVYMDPGDFQVQLVVTDENGCTDQATQMIGYRPVPALIVIAPSTFEGCSPADIFFNNLSFPIDETYTINWDFDDGSSSSVISPSHIFTEIGSYTISVEIISPIGCVTDTVFQDLIRVSPSPTAAFSYNPQELRQFNATANFQDESLGANAWFWDFNGAFTTSEQNPTYTFRDTGLHEVRLIATNAFFCRDTIVETIDVIPEVRYFLPNAFSPNNDGTNDFFKGKGILNGAKSFDLQIWNRWGELIFETQNPDDAWDGNSQKTGRMAPPGVYVCFVRYTGPRGTDFELKGFATLIR